MVRKPKNIHLSEDEKMKLTIQGAKKGLDLKNYIEWFLSKLANNKVEIKD